MRCPLLSILLLNHIFLAKQMKNIEATKRFSWVVWRSCRRVFILFCTQAAIRNPDEILPAVHGSLLSCPCCRYYKVPGRFAEAVEHNLQPPVCGRCVHRWCMLHKALKLRGDDFNQSYAEYKRVNKRKRDREWMILCPHIKILDCKDWFWKLEPFRSNSCRRETPSSSIACTLPPAAKSNKHIYQ